jgi:anti-anti-sigma regulatory factor
VDLVTTTRLPGPEMTEIVNARIGAIRVAGRLTPQGGDLLRGTVESLRRSGHTRVLIDLAQLQSADAEAVQLLRDVDRAVAEDGGTLLLQHAPRWLADQASSGAHSSSVR